MDVGGITVLQRSIKQLGRMSGVKVVVASDGTVDLPDPMPANATVRQLAGDVPTAIASLQDELGNPDVLRGDVVRVHFRRMDGGYRVVDEATRRRAEDAVFADLLRGDLGFVARHINKKISFRITRYLLCKLPVTPNQVTIAGGPHRPARLLPDRDRPPAGDRARLLAGPAAVDPRRLRRRAGARALPADGDRRMAGHHRRRRPQPGAGRRHRRRPVAPRGLDRQLLVGAGGSGLRDAARLQRHRLPRAGQAGGRGRCPQDPVVVGARARLQVIARRPGRPQRLQLAGRHRQARLLRLCLAGPGHPGSVAGGAVLRVRPGAGLRGRRAGAALLPPPPPPPPAPENGAPPPARPPPRRAAGR